jgi:hypothetical protein
MAVVMMLRLGTQIQKHPGHTWTVSQWEREAIGERTRNALRHQRTRERVGKIRFGFRLSPDGKHVEPDPASRACKRKSVTCARAGTPCEGLRPPSIGKRCGRAVARRGGWSTVARIIKQATVAR